ncbi:MAG: DNA repair protein RecO [Candidatus Doudnabacteria bacterium RIFCSPLOWO2_01_FULL_44_21]|uniref:DNA repair protein RecO n=1 Tax=Candidatus Doudnabacteria bacterium RIFCSPLOWO2_01_FULL_44_21 TaxID=1817841 RepID=A0A1F5Q655_9BACT|nr:MAG: DNA repair protein RecO [Candidatus Doudnabacteria bacterium RIFCSPHIGHO2_02_FULL_43_13b]OGE97300.1 MAG: DNA repair protein RecO [Candidatus Doudnabacteria bacterium RIFCSPLOWO2_01_FULL_44_21]
MQYKKLKGVILKKQNFREADQIITVWTSEVGKIRILARGLRLPKSKLVYNLSELSLVEFEITGRKNFPTVISAQTAQSFNHLRHDLLKIANAIYASELVMKMTADEHPNQVVYQLLVDFLHQLNQAYGLNHYQLLDRFALKLAQALGFGQPKQINSHSDVRNFIEELIERQIKSEPFLAQI